MKDVEEGNVAWCNLTKGLGFHNSFHLWQEELGKDIQPRCLINSIGSIARGWVVKTNFYRGHGKQTRSEWSLWGKGEWELALCGLNLKCLLLAHEFECLVSTLWSYFEGCGTLGGRAQLLKHRSLGPFEKCSHHWFRVLRSLLPHLSQVRKLLPCIPAIMTPSKPSPLWWTESYQN